MTCNYSEFNAAAQVIELSVPWNGPQWSADQDLWRSPVMLPGLAPSQRVVWEQARECPDAFLYPNLSIGSYTWRIFDLLKKARNANYYFEMTGSNYEGNSSLDRLASDLRIPAHAIFECAGGTLQIKECDLGYSLDYYRGSQSGYGFLVFFAGDLSSEVVINIHSSEPGLETILREAESGTALMTSATIEW